MCNKRTPDISIKQITDDVFFIFQSNFKGKYQKYITKEEVFKYLNNRAIKVLVHFKDNETVSNYK